MTNTIIPMTGFLLSSITFIIFWGTYFDIPCKVISPVMIDCYTLNNKWQMVLSMTITDMTITNMTNSKSIKALYKCGYSFRISADDLVAGGSILDCDIN